MERKTLVLTSWMKPHSIMTWQQSICLVDVLRDGKCIQVGKADTLESYEATVSSPSVTLQIPAVVRLRREMKTHKNGVKFSRINVLTRDGFRCAYCGERKAASQLNYDHVIPRVQGGLKVWNNIVTACHKCNSRKGGRTPEQAGMTLRFKPHRPTTLPMSAPLIYDVATVPEQWKPYLGAGFFHEMARSA